MTGNTNILKTKKLKAIYGNRKSINEHVYVQCVSDTLCML